MHKPITRKLSVRSSSLVFEKCRNGTGKHTPQAPADYNLNIETTRHGITQRLIISHLLWIGGDVDMAVWSL